MINLSQILLEIIKNNQYEHPEDFHKKALNFLNSLNNSKDKDEQKKFKYLLSQITLQHNLKPLFDYYSKLKREERLKKFMFMQMQYKGMIIRKIKKEKQKKIQEKEDKEVEEEVKKQVELFSSQEKYSDAFILFKLNSNLKNTPLSEVRVIDNNQKIILKNDFNDKNILKINFSLLDENKSQEEIDKLILEKEDEENIQEEQEKKQKQNEFDFFHKLKLDIFNKD